MSQTKSAQEDFEAAYAEYPDADGADQPSKRHTEILNMISRSRKGQTSSRMYTLLHECIAECIGTMFIVVFGVGSVCSAIVLKDRDVPLWHVTVIWGFGIALAILVSASVSGGHLNPAVSLGFALFRPADFPFRKLLPFWAAQYIGGVLGGAFNLMIFGPALRNFEEVNSISRGSDESVATAMMFGEYFPAPLGLLDNSVISSGFALLVEAWGTGILMFIIFAVTDGRQKIIKGKEMVPFYIGFTVAVLMTLYTPMTQGGFNPARDFGPRLVAVMAGWGKIAIPGPRNGFWVYIIGPKLGALVGALLYNFLIVPGLSN